MHLRSRSFVIYAISLILSLVANAQPPPAQGPPQPFDGQPFSNQTQIPTPSSSSSTIAAESTTSDSSTSSIPQSTAISFETYSTSTLNATNFSLANIASPTTTNLSPSSTSTTFSPLATYLNLLKTHKGFFSSPLIPTVTITLGSLGVLILFFVLWINFRRACCFPHRRYKQKVILARWSVQSFHEKGKFGFGKIHLPPSPLPELPYSGPGTPLPQLETGTVIVDTERMSRDLSQEMCLSMAMSNDTSKSRWSAATSVMSFPSHSVYSKEEDFTDVDHSPNSSQMDHLSKTLSALVGDTVKAPPMIRFSSTSSGGSAFRFDRTYYDSETTKASERESKERTSRIQSIEKIGQYAQLTRHSKRQDRDSRDSNGSRGGQRKGSLSRKPSQGRTEKMERILERSPEMTGLVTPKGSNGSGGYRDSPRSATLSPSPLPTPMPPPLISPLLTALRSPARSPGFPTIQVSPARTSPFPVSPVRSSPLTSSPTPTRSPARSRAQSSARSPFSPSFSPALAPPLAPVLSPAPKSTYTPTLTPGAALSVTPGLSPAISPALSHISFAASQATLVPSPSPLMSSPLAAAQFKHLNYMNGGDRDEVERPVKGILKNKHSSTPLTRVSMVAGNRI